MISHHFLGPIRWHHLVPFHKQEFSWHRSSMAIDDVLENDNFCQSDWFISCPAPCGSTLHALPSCIPRWPSPLSGVTSLLTGRNCYGFMHAFYSSFSIRSVEWPSSWQNNSFMDLSVSVIDLSPFWQFCWQGHPNVSIRRNGQPKIHVYRIHSYKA